MPHALVGGANCVLSGVCKSIEVSLDDLRPNDFLLASVAPDAGVPDLDMAYMLAVNTGQLRKKAEEKQFGTTSNHNG